MKKPPCDHLRGCGELESWLPTSSSTRPHPQGREGRPTRGRTVLCGFLRHLPEHERHPPTPTYARPEHPLAKMRRVRSVVAHIIYPRLNIIHPHPHPQIGRKTTCGGEGVGGHLPSAHTSFPRLFHTLRHLSSSTTNSTLPLATKSQ